MKVSIMKKDAVFELISKKTQSKKKKIINIDKYIICFPIVLFVAVVIIISHYNFLLKDYSEIVPNKSIVEKQELNASIEEKTVSHEVKENKSIDVNKKVDVKVVSAPSKKEVKQSVKNTKTNIQEKLNKQKSENVVNTTDKINVNNKVVDTKNVSSEVKSDLRKTEDYFFE